jgi:hypothetical protein
MRSDSSAPEAVRRPRERSGTIHKSDNLRHYGWLRKWVTLIAIATPQLLQGDTITGFDNSRWSLFSGNYQPGSGNVPGYSGLGILDPNTLQLNASSSPTLNTGDCVSAAWYNTKVAVNSFQATFTWEVTGADFSSGFGPADGFTFVFQNQGLDANGGFGGGLGYFTYGTPGITTSAGLEFRVYRAGTGYVENAGLVTYGGDLGDGAAVSLDALNHPIDITITYDGTTLTETLKDQLTGGTFSTSYNANIPAAVGDSTAFVGFTSGTGNGTMDDFITNFRFDSSGFVPPPPPPPPPPLPVATVPSATLPVPAGGNTTLTESATGVAPITYQWYQGNGGDTSQPVGTNGPTWTTPALLNSTSYWVRVTDGNGQSADSPALLVTVVPVGLGLGNTVACAGSDVSIPFIATGFASIGSFQASIQWDPTVVVYTGFDASAIPSLSADDIFSDPALGFAIVAWEDATIAGATVPDGSTLFSLHFHLSGAPGTSTPVVVTNSPTPLEVTDADGTVLTAALSAGQIQILGSLNLTGSVAYYRASAPVPGVTLQLGGGSSSSISSGADGLFSIPVPSCADLTLTPELSTDTPLTKGITMLDVQAVRSHIQGQTKLTSPFALLAADVNGSRTITAADLRLIRLFILQLRTNFPASGGNLWRFVPSDYVFPDPLSPWDAPGTRFITGLQAAPAGQNFQAIKLGDVDGSWDPAPQSPNRSITILDTHAGSVHLSATEQLVNAGDSVQIAVTASQVDRLTTAQFTLTWDPSVLKFTGTSGYNLTGMDAESFGTSRVDRGRLHVGWDDPNLQGVMVSEGQTLFVAHFKVMGGQGSSSAIQISGNPTPIELSSGRRIIPTTTASGLVAVRTATPGTLWVTIPNENQLQLSYESPEGTSWEVEASGDLVHWTLVGAGTVDSKNSLATVTLPLQTNRMQFYRAVQVD